MLIHVCQLCGYEYDPKKGDIENDIEKDTDFDELPADWVCPLCGAGKEDFSDEFREADEDEDED